MVFYLLFEVVFWISMYIQKTVCTLQSTGSHLWMCPLLLQQQSMHIRMHTHTYMKACIVINDKFVRICMCSLGHDTITTSVIRTYLQSNRQYQNDLLMQMEYQRKKASSELQQAQRELDMAQVSGMRVHTFIRTYILTHLYAPIFAQPHTTHTCGHTTTHT